MRFVSDERQHDEISVQAIEAMALIRIPLRLRLAMSNVFENLMFSFSRNL